MRNKINPFDFQALKFDVIIGNPPYMKTEDIKKITPEEKNIYENKYVSAYKQYDKYFLFVERSLSLLTTTGVVGYILPNKFMKVGAAKKLRGLLSQGYVSDIISFGANQIFQDKTTYTCIIRLYIPYCTENEMLFEKINQMLRNNCEINEILDYTDKKILKENLLLSPEDIELAKHIRQKLLNKRINRK